MRNNSVPLYSLKDLRRVRDNFADELTRAARGEKTSLAFFKTPLPKKPLVSEGELFQVMVVGGSKFETALMKVQHGAMRMMQQKKGTLSLFKTKGQFIHFFEMNLDSQVAVVGLNFAFGLKPLIRDNLLDGVLVGVGKEHSFAGLLNQMVGKQLEDSVFQKEKRVIKISCANDTICLLLSGIEITSRKNLVGGIVGSGTNFAFFLDELTAVNLQSGSFDKLQQTETGRAVDGRSLYPGRSRFEKEVAGSYLYQHFNLLTDQGKLKTARLASTSQLSSIAQKNQGEDSFIARRLLERSASLTACQISGIYFFKKEPRLMVVMEGSLFWHGWNYKNMVERYLKLLGVSESAVRFAHIERGNIVGAARLVAGGGDKMV